MRARSHHQGSVGSPFGAYHALLGASSGPAATGRPETARDSSWETPSTAVDDDTRRNIGRLMEVPGGFVGCQRRRDRACDGRLNDLLSSIIVHYSWLHFAAQPYSPGGRRFRLFDEGCSDRKREIMTLLSVDETRRARLHPTQR
jgi:hypothetical protein